VTFYTGLASTASRLLTSKGQVATWAHDNNDGSFNPATGTTTGGTTTAYTANGVLLDFETRRVNGTSVLRTDKRFLMQVGSKPSVSDSVTVNSVTYQVIAVTETSPAGTPVLYEAQLRS
tara:strand:+ start:5624 stop:5980 length:357 start_codon:yes stop_codon:yes gene_type:complete